MERIKFFTAIIGTVCCLMITSLYADNKPYSYSPVGYWKTIDSLTGKPKSILRIWETPQKTLAASVVKVFVSSGESEQPYCTACTGEKHNQPILGMVILTGLKMGRGQWSNGQMLDPHNGKVYRCSMSLYDRGARLRMHGYIGLPLFGRSETWERVDLLSDADVHHVSTANEA